MKSAQSIINNLRSIEGNRFGAEKALACLDKAKAVIGKCKRDTLIVMVLYAFENNPEYSEAQHLVKAGNSDEDRAKNCLSVLRRMRGQSEQSLISSMVLYAYRSNPKFRKK